MRDFLNLCLQFVRLCSNSIWKRSCPAILLRGRIDQLVEMLKVRRVYVRNGAEFLFAFSPIHPSKALPGTCARWTVPFPCGPDEYINWTSTAHRFLAELSMGG